MNPFSFEHTFQFDEKLYVQLNSLFTKKNRPIRIGLFLLAGIVSLFWKYTILVGVAIILLVLVSLFMQGRIPNTVANNYRTMNYLHHELTYGVSEEKLWVIGKQLIVEFGWDHAVVWDEREGWLRITANNTPTVWFQIAQLKKEAIYDNVIELCKKHSVRFDS